ncbi:MAG: hypothetical protein JWO67_3752 [Streptosporangiaceae bacterium]|nr:hypothetical protein [Streptosporangiaceae bacterium]
MTYLRSLLKYEPAIVAWALNGGIALVAAYLLHFTKTQEAAAATVVTALAGAYTAIKARPFAVAALTGALMTAVTAAAAFGFHPTAQVTAAVLAVVSAVLPLVLRANLTPLATVKRMQLASARASLGHRPFPPEPAA